ncbi:hypothetical protein Fcan01_11146 [Folsomia candida]|uniref:Uncharacterized protein n=1 Tax=Folsomia candida TaxID=158441 RepID=A0A226EA52_FOLCA|nr:hypothetical protein Fcan01_11146 [Folsomia candida]
MQFFLVSFLVAVTISESVGGGINVNKEIATYSTCNGKSVVFPPETVTKGILAAANFLGVEDEFCAKLCVYRHMDGPMTGNKLNKVWMKKEGRKTSMGDEDAKDKIIAGVDKCLKDDAEMVEVDGKCPAFQKVYDCMLKNYEIICKGKKA